MLKNKSFLNVIIIAIITLSACHSTKKIESKSNFDTAQKSLIIAQDSMTPMRVFKITNYEDSILLRTQCTDIDFSADKFLIEHFTKRLYHTVRDSMSLGVGIAAPQVGILKNIIWVQRFDKEDYPFEVYINPHILSYSKLKQDCREGCLSIPDRSDTTHTRSYAIMMEYNKIDGSQHIEMIEDFTAVIFQHEIDHLNGILYLDHLESELKAATRK